MRKDQINLAALSRAYSDKMGRKITFTGIQKIGSGYHSDGFQLTSSDGRSFFVKYLRSHDLGFEFPERKVMSLMVSHGMGRRARSDTASLGAIIIDGDDGLVLPEITDTMKIYHLQEFAGTGTSYSTVLKKNLKKKEVDDTDRRQLSAIADRLVNIHSVKHPSKNKDQRTAVYNDGLRNMLTHPELSIMVLSEFPADHPILNLKGQQEMISLMYGNIKAWMGRSDRLTALHGDFWGANIFFREDESIFIIDFSRIPWGDPAIDVGWFIAEYLWYYHLTGNPYFKELAETWLDIYGEKSGDKEIRKAIPLVLGWIGIVQIYPRWFPDIDVAVGRTFIGHIKAILKHKELIWKNF